MKRPISYKTAFVVSIILHGLGFLFIGLILIPNEKSFQNESPIVLDFIAIPGTEEQQLSHEIEQADAASVNLLGNVVIPASYPKSFAEKEPQQNDIIDDCTNAEDNQSHPFKQKSQSPLNLPYYASVFMPPVPNFQHINFAEPKLISANLTVSEQQEKILTKEIKKLMENLPDLDSIDSTFMVKDKNRTYQIQIHHCPAVDDMKLDEFLVQISTEEQGQKLATQLRMRRLAFSNFAQLVDFWDPRVAIHDDKLEGRFHTNYAFAISRSKGISPKVHGKVTTAAFEIKKSGIFPIIDEESIFVGGIEMGVKEIRLPKVFSPFSSHTQIDSKCVHYLTEQTWITFHKNGSYTWKAESSLEREHRKEIPQRSFFIVGNKRATIHVKGIVNGKVLVYSAGNIIIDADLLYARHPEAFSGADDYLGLVSEKDIEIAHPSVTGRGDLQIFAAIYARQRFQIPHLQGNSNALLYIYGSLTAGSLSATEPRYGTRIVFDKRLETHRPPHFPLTERYELVEWIKEWKVIDY